MRASSFLNIKFIIGATCLILIFALAVVGGLVTPHDSVEQDLMNSLQPPTFDVDRHYLGTDQLGRDIFARMVSGARVSLMIAVSVVALSGVFGVIYGALSGYWSGIRDVVLQKIVETFWAFPPILLALALLAFMGQSLFNLVLALSIQRWIPYSRIARAHTLVLREREFVAASRMMGASTAWVVRHHILPNLISPSIVIGTFSMATAILAEASLSFLGLGVPPEIATWGGMLSEGRSYADEAWWIAVFPGVGIFLTVLGLNLVGDWLRDLFDPNQTSKLR